MALTIVVVGAAASANGDELVFEDSFETGDFKRWSSVEPPPAPKFRFSVDSASVNEGAGEVQLLVQLMDGGVARAESSTSSASVRVRTLNAEAAGGSDYGCLDVVLTFSPGVTSVPLTIYIFEDLLDEVDETFTVSLSDPETGTLGQPATATVTIKDNDWPPFVYLADGGFYSATYDAFEQFGEISIPVRLSEPSGRETQVTFGTSDGTAIAGEDYGELSETLVFAPGQTEFLVTIPVTTDPQSDSREYFHVTIFSPVECSLDDMLPDAGEVTIHDDLWVEFTESEIPVPENAGSVKVQINLSVAADKDINVEYATSDVTATAGEDYTSAVSYLWFSPGATDRYLQVLIGEDSLREGDESFTVSLGDVSGLPISGPSVAKVTILDNDVPEVFLESSSFSFGEEDGQVYLGVSLSGEASDDVIVSYVMSEGTALDPLDFLQASGTVTIPAGQTAGYIPLSIVEDDLIEGRETFSVALTGAQGGVVRSRGTGTVSIIDNELRAVIGEPEGRVYCDGQVLGIDGTKSVVPPGYDSWFAVLRDDGSDLMEVVQLADGLTGSFQTSGAVPAYRVRLVVAAPGSIPLDTALRGEPDPCANQEPPSSCVSDEVVVEHSDLNTCPFTTRYVFPDAVLLVWGGSSTPSMELERSSDGGQSWVAFQEPGNQDHDGGTESYTSFTDRTVDPGQTYHYRIKWNTFSEWYYLGNTSNPPGDPVITPVWDAPRPVPSFESVEWNCPQGASRFQCFGNLGLTLNPEPGESLGGTTVSVFVNEDTFEAVGGDGGEVPIIWPGSFPFAGRDEPGCVERNTDADLVIEVPADEESVTVNLPNVRYGANSFRFVVEDSDGGYSERALLYGIHDEVGLHDAVHEPLAPLLFGTSVSVEHFQIFGLGPVGIRSPDCADGDQRRSTWGLGENVLYTATLAWGGVTTRIGADEHGRWTNNLDLLNGVDYGFKTLPIDSCWSETAGHVGRSILDDSGFAITTTQTAQEICPGSSQAYLDPIHVDTGLDGPHAPAIDVVPSSLFSLSDNQVVVLPVRFRVTDLHHDVDVSSVTITNESLDPPTMVYGFYADNQDDRDNGDWGWFVAEVPVGLPLGATAFENALRFHVSDYAGQTADQLFAVTRQKPLVWAEIGEPDPPEVERGEVVAFDGTASIVPGLDEIGGGVARWLFFHQVGERWAQYRDAGFANGSEGLRQRVEMPRESRLKARLIVAASLLDFPSDPWTTDPPCSWNEGDGRCDS
ncbi:MAG: hypothetical protein LJE93_14245, partial [Acidobacteria bacterium]|nr:hypothetical protein [Acidobacteriota bacterium]